MKLIIDSSLTLQNIPSEFKAWFIEELTFENPKYREAKKQGRWTKNIPRYLDLYTDTLNGIIIPRGYLQVIEDAIIGQGHSISITDNRVLLSPIFLQSNIKLFKYQQKYKYALLSHPNGVLVSPAGSGKTILGLDLIASLHQKALWLTHTNRLASQVKDRMLSCFTDLDEKEIGMIGAGKFSIGNRITIGMIPTLVRRENELLSIGREFGLVILDETHHAPASTFLKVLSYFSSFYMYGLTATPRRRDGLEGMMFASIGMANAVIPRRSVSKAKKIITPIVYKRTVYSNVVEDNDYAFILREIIPRNKARLSQIVSDIIYEAKQGNLCIAISTRKAYAEQVFELVKRTWPAVGIATGDYSTKDNDEAVFKLERREITVLITTFELLGEGFDVKELNRAFLITPFREKTRVEQAVGRIQRVAEGKKDAILYDYVDENIGILRNQFIDRAMTYRMLGIQIINKN